MKLASNKLNAKIGYVNFFVKNGKTRSLGKSLPILVVHVADTNKHKKVFKPYHDSRDGDSVGRMISEKQFKNWIYNLARDFFATTSCEFDTSLVDYTPYQDVKHEGNTLAEGLRSAFYEAIK